MEFRARYVLIGLFTLAVIASVFGFVYWLNNMAGFGPRAVYQVRFTVPVSGLTVGSDVFFNGINVGEVTDLAFEPEEPSQLSATISIDKNTPVRSDTMAGVDYQGLTGISNILLIGGSPTAPFLAPRDGKPPSLIAEPSATRSLSQNAGRVLSRFEDILGRNSNRFDSILSGLERMTGDSTSESDIPVYDLIPPQTFPKRDKAPSWQLVVAEPTVTLALNTDKIQQRPREGESLALSNARWSDNLPNLFQAKIMQSFENAGYIKAVLRPADAPDPDYRLLIDIRGFHLTTRDKPAAEIDFIAKIIDRDGKIIAARPFRDTIPAAAVDVPGAVAALRKVFSSSVTELVTWTAAVL